MSTSGSNNTVIAATIAIASAAIVGICLSQTLTKKQTKATNINTTPDDAAPSPIILPSTLRPVVAMVVNEEIKDAYTDDNLFFGTVSCYFTPAPGSAYRYRADNFSETDDAANKALSRSRMHPVAFLGVGYESLIVPAIPATDIVVVKDNDVTSWPLLLRQPLMKARAGVGKIVGISSGVRSAVIKIDGRWYRLKGCGNNDKGFIFATISETSPFVNIRGCSFEHTTHRELFMTDAINQLLAKEGLIGANTSTGWWEYALKDKTPLPKVLRTCVVCECLGERRLGDHLMNGIERIIPLLLPRIDTAAALAILGPNRQADDAGHATWLAQQILDDLKYCDIFTNAAFREQQAPASLPAGVDKRWLPLWNKNAAIVANAIKLLSNKGASVGSLLAYLHWRVGRESGLIIRILQDNKISWGTYSDAMGTHCNAHSNNLVVRMEGDATSPFLAPLDLDMAFTSKSHLWETKDGKKDDEEFNKWMTIELASFKGALAGDEESSTGIKARSALPSQYLPYKWLLRDTLMSGFESGFARRTDEHALVPELTSSIYALMRLALITTSDDLA